MQRVLARVFIYALRSKAVQTLALETSVYIGKRATQFLLRKLQAGAKPLKD